MSDKHTCGNPLPCKWYTQYAALERDHIKKWEQIDALQRENDKLREAGMADDERISEIRDAATRIADTVCVSKDAVIAVLARVGALEVERDEYAELVQRVSDDRARISEDRRTIRRERDALRARAERLVKAYCCPHAWACDCFIDEMDDFRAALSTSDAK